MGAIWRGFLDIIFGAMQFVYSFVGDWGLSIIVVTILFRFLVWPLMVKQVRSMRAMQKIQPLMKEVQKKYADDKDKQGQEMMKLYQEHKVNPLAGCLPVLLQMPLFIGFFAVLMAPRIVEHILVTDVSGGVIVAPPLYGIGPLPHYLGYVDGAVHMPDMLGTASFFNILPNLMIAPSVAWETLSQVQALPYIVLLILSSVGILLPTLMTQRGQDTPQAKQQKFIGYSMAVFMTFIGWGFFPGGVLLYMTTSSLVAAGQQFFVQYRMDKEDAAEAAAAEDEKAKKKANRKKGNKSKDK